MQITLSAEVQQALNEQARRTGRSPEELVVEALNERFVASVSPVQPRDEWGRRLLSAASDCGVSLPHQALSSDGLYD